ncbi:hypothetical protein MTP99_018762 [Tenebrio molitor]|nr:hypothetical protein MTP99_018762 [Tenebrio molitor]
MQHVSYLACKQQPTTPLAERTLRVTETSTIIKDLIPYSKYSFSVFAENTKLKGLPSEFLEDTLATDEIESEEIPEVDQLQFCLLSNKEVQCLSLNYREFFKKVSEIPLGCNSTILVHSSSGMHGNTFVLICDICLRTSKKDGVVDVLGNLQRLTEYNTNFVIDCDHYVLTHLVILENLLRVDTSINCNSLDMSRTHLFTVDETEMHLRYLKYTLWMDAGTRTLDRESNIYFRAVFPLDDGKVFLEAYNLGEENSPCWNRLGPINVDGFRCPNKFLVVPQPTSTTLSDIWDLVVEKNVSVILSLNKITPSSTNVPFLPGKNKAKVSSNASVEPKLTRDFGSYEWTTLKLNSKTKHQTVDILSMKTWLAKTSCPPDLSDFVNFCIAANERMKESRLVMVTCCDGVRRHCLQFVNDKVNNSEGKHH